jgi:hypothetical protein
MLLRLAYLGITSTFALLRLLPDSDRDKDAEILARRHQLAVLQRQLDGQRIRFDPCSVPKPHTRPEQGFVIKSRNDIDLDSKTEF